MSWFKIIFKWEFESPRGFLINLYLMNNFLLLLCNQISFNEMLFMSMRIMRKEELTYHLLGINKKNYHYYYNDWDVLLQLKMCGFQNSSIIKSNYIFGFYENEFHYYSELPVNFFFY